MKQMRFLLAFVLFVVLAVSVTTSGCKKDDGGTPVDEFVEGDIFPISEGTKITYNGFLREKADPPADTNITATGAVYETRWTIMNDSASIPGPPIGPGGVGILILDSTRVPTGVPSPPTIWVESPVYIQRLSNGGFRFLTDIGRFYRLFGVNQTDSLKLVHLADVSTKIGGTWTAYNESFSSSTVGSVRLEIVGRWDKENITVNGQNFSTYKVTTSRNVYIPATSTTPAPGSGGLTAQVWLATGIGPVKLILHGNPESNGHYREFLSRVP
jgi:hypothetical protein